VEHAVAETVAIQRRALHDLRELESPRRDEPGVTQWLRRVDRALDQTELLREGLETGDRAVIFDATTRGAAESDGAEEFADAYGLDDCSTTPPEER